MKIIIALGNPGKKYEGTRHNAGFLAMDFLLDNLKFKIKNSQNNFESEVFGAKIDNEKIILVKPQTFMNESGKAVRTICDFYKIDVQKDLLVLHDDTDLPLGTIKKTGNSSSAGHNGVQNIIDKLGTQNFHRVRIGVESRENKNILPTEVFVLQNFSGEETDKLRTEIFPKLTELVSQFIDGKR